MFILCYSLYVFHPPPGSIVLKNIEIRPVTLTRGNEIIVRMSLQFQVPSGCSDFRASFCGALGAVVCTVLVCLGYATIRKQSHSANESYL